MGNIKKIVDKIINNPDILYPSDQFPGIVLDNNDFLSFEEFLELSRQETVKKYTVLRDIANSIIKKDGILQGIAYSEVTAPKLTLLFRGNEPLDYQERYKQINQKTKEEKALEKNIEVSENLSENRDRLNVINSTRKSNQLDLEYELMEYQEKYKEYLDLIADYKSSISVHTNKGSLVSSNKDQPYDKVFAAYDISEDILNYLLNASNLTSDIEMEFVRQYFDELTRYKEALASGVLYPDFCVTDYTGQFYIKTNHSHFCIFKQENAINIPREFGLVNIYLYNSSIHFDLLYRACNDNCSIKSSLFANKNDLLLERGFIHKALLPEGYKKH